MLLMNGGTAGIDSPTPYSANADGLLKALAVDPRALSTKTRSAGGAALQVPLIAVTVTHAARRRLPQHRRWARWTLPLWLWVSLSGVAVWVLNFGMRPA